MFAARPSANMSSPVNHTLMPVLLVDVGTEHATFHIQSPAKAQELVCCLCCSKNTGCPLVLNLNMFFYTSIHPIYLFILI